MKACTVYLLALIVFVASASAGVDGMVLCLCGDGSVEIEKACGDAKGCCDETHFEASDGSHPSEHQCSDCTDLPLNGLDTLAANNPRTVTKVAPDALVISLPGLVMPTDADSISARLLLTAIPVHQQAPHTLSTVFRI
ncbi:MAG: hypothetical protein IT367_08510 [Candidatus Hydrogenedentes bacterium]|nr:hypothetical protein [Candidatus Hydrogenedentota bacterium]